MFLDYTTEILPLLYFPCFVLVAVLKASCCPQIQHYSPSYFKGVYSGELKISKYIEIYSTRWWLDFVAIQEF